MTRVVNRYLSGLAENLSIRYALEPGPDEVPIKDLVVIFGEAGRLMRYPASDVYMCRLSIPAIPLIDLIA